MEESNVCIKTALVQNSYIRTQIEIQGTTVTGLQIVKDNKGLTIKSRKEIIVSAGAFNSPQLLMLSGIGPKEELQKHKVIIKCKNKSVLMYTL